ncbi:hypothetical protein [Brevundimonas diminuta]|nr:hypothetical protein [Brevundimonas diminuta]
MQPMIYLGLALLLGVIALIFWVNARRSTRHRGGEDRTTGTGRSEHN